MLTKDDKEFILKAISPLKEDIKSVKKDLVQVIQYIDKETSNLDKRVIKIEKHVGLPTPLN